MKDNELNTLFAYQIDHHVIGGHTVSVQTVTEGVVDTFSANDIGDIIEWLEANYPQAIEMINVGYN